METTDVCEGRKVDVRVGLNVVRRLRDLGPLCIIFWYYPRI